ncbi:hypothetical protein [Thermococcus eurythermalis]|nr:hypothetical protein [Thermococcus eurythermalis]
MARVLWVLKAGDRLYSKVLDEYPYYVELNVSTGEHICTCPRGGDCPHVSAVKEAYEKGIYFDAGGSEPLNPEALAWSYLSEVPRLALDVAVAELFNSLKRDESGSESAMLFLRALRLVRETGAEEYLHVLGEALDELSAVFHDYPLVEKLREGYEHTRRALEKEPL